MKNKKNHRLSVTVGKKRRFTASSAEELEGKIAEGLVELDRGEGISSKRVFAELKARSKQLQTISS